MNPNAASNGLSAADLAFFGTKENWYGGPQLHVVLSYRTSAEVNEITLRLAEVVDVVMPWAVPWQSKTKSVIVSPPGLRAPIGLCYYTTDGKDFIRKSGGRTEIPPRLHMFISPPQLARAGAYEAFWETTEPTQTSIRLFEYLVHVARRAYTVLPFEYAHVLDETWGFLGSREHNPCIATYPQFAEAAGWMILGTDPIYDRHALIGVT